MTNGIAPRGNMYWISAALLAVLPLALLSACGDGGDDEKVDSGIVINRNGQPVARPAPDQRIDAPGFVDKARAESLLQIRMAQAVMANSDDPEFDGFGQAIIDQREQSIARIEAAAKAAGIAVKPAALDATQQKMLDELTSVKPENMEFIYLTAQHIAQKNGLSLHRAYGLYGDNAALKQIALDSFAQTEADAERLKKLHPK